MYSRIERKEVTIVLLGFLGSGKSSTGNSILSEKKFKVKAGTVLTTKDVQNEITYVNDDYVQVIDTPGLENASQFPDLYQKLKPMLQEIKNGLVVTAVVIRVGRYTGQERILIEDLFKKYKQHLKNPMIIFTNREELDDEENPKDRFVDAWVSKNPSLQAIIGNNSLKFISFKNKHQTDAENSTQVNDLLETIFARSKAKPYCPVSPNHKNSDHVKGVYITREQLKEAFGNYGLMFYDKIEGANLMKFNDNFSCRCNTYTNIFKNSQLINCQFSF